jgi:hypothetical protein
MPTTYGNLYPRVYEFTNLYQAYLRARRGKRTRAEAIRFRRNLEGNLIQIQNELIWKTYRTGAYRTFKVFEPKERLISALPFYDRVVQHALWGLSSRSGKNASSLIHMPVGWGREHMRAQIARSGFCGRPRLAGQYTF